MVRKKKVREGEICSLGTRVRVMEILDRMARGDLADYVTLEI